MTAGGLRPAGTGYFFHPTLEYEAIQVRLPPMPILIITEKTSQARDLRAALGDRFGQILPAEGHLLRTAATPTRCYPGGGSLGGAAMRQFFACLYALTLPSVRACRITAFTCLIAAIPVIAFARTFGGFECTDDCSGHAAGYRWAEEHNIDDEDTCPEGNSQSFHEGCLAYVQDPTRGADEDDDGEPID